MVATPNSAVESTRLPGQPTELSAEAAEQIALAARAEFADTTDAEGRRAALKTFNLRVSWWANQFTDRRLKRFAWTLGTAMYGETHSFRVSVEKLRRQHPKLHPDAYLNKATGKPRMLSKSQILRYLGDLEEAEIIEVIRERQDESGDCPGAQKVNVYTVRFDRVIRYGSVAAHDFMAADQRKHSKNDTRDDTRPATRDDTLTCSSTGSSSCSSTCSSSPLRGAAHDDEHVEAGRDSGKGPTARVGGGTAQDDSASPGNREGSQPSSAAPPGGGTPAAPSHASRAKRELDEFDGLAQKLAEIWGPEFAADLLAPRFRRVSREAGISAGTAEDLLCWWLNRYAPARFKHPSDEYEDADGNVVKAVPNPGCYLYRIFPDLVQAYLAARDEQAAELGVDPATFDLDQWLADQEDQAADGQEDEPLPATQEETMAETRAIARELADLRGVTYDVVRREVIDYAASKNYNATATLIHYRQELQQAREMAAA